MTEAPPAPVYAFGSFRLFPQTGVLQDNGRDVRLGSRAVELLTAPSYCGMKAASAKRSRSWTTSWIACTRGGTP